ncbi:MAG: TonB-dependent receptor, partial [Sphingomonas sp.]
TLTANMLYANNIEREQRSDVSNWFSRPFDVVTFDGNTDADTTTFLHETLTSPKDVDFEQQDRAQKNRLQDYGLNAKWDITNNFSFSLDGHIGKSTVKPGLSNGTSSTLLGTGANVVASHSVDYSSGIPVEHIVFDDSNVNSAAPGGIPGVLDSTDVSSSVGRTFTNSVSQRVKEIRGDFGWDVGEGNRVDFGAIYRETKTRQSFSSTQQTLGDWSASKPGDIDKYAPGVLQEFCLTCRFHKFDPQATGVDAIAFRGDAITLLDALSPVYGGSLNPNGGVNSDNEKIWGGYVQSTWKFQLGGLDAGLVAGVRYEHTTEDAVSVQDATTAIIWQSDNDFIVTHSSATQQTLTGHGSYGNFLPSADFQVNLTHNLIGRLSASRTIARPNYNLLFPATTVNGGPPRPTVLGGYPTASGGNTALKPLTSDNLDASMEWYFKRDSYISLGGFYKHVKNFIGNGTTTGPLLGLRDPTAATPGTRSGNAKAQLTALGADITDVNLFTLTALIDQNNGNVAAATNEFKAHYDATARSVNNDYANQILTQYDVTADANDPLFNFAISQPINNKAADLYGAEVAAQYFFGNTGIGVSGSFTYVDGNVGFDNGGATDVQQFALTGLSNTANATLIYDKNGISARVAYNWRDKFLAATGRDAYQNPVYTAPYSTVDFDFTYDISPQWSISITGQNLTNEALHTYGRDPTNLWFYQELQRRFTFGTALKF